jgi:uncharacterized protein
MADFYQHHSRKLLWFMLLTFPFLYIESVSIPTNNDIEAWLPDDIAIRTDYEQFKLDFGAEELLLIGLSVETETSGMAEAIAARLERIPGIAECWAPSYLDSTMAEFGVSTEERQKRLQGLSRSRDGELIALIATLSPEGIADRASLVSEVKVVLAYCQLDRGESLISGAPVVITELDRLGNQEESGKFFLLTLLISLFLLYRSLRHWKLTFALLGQTLWAIQLSGALLKWSGGEANFILGALSILVMVFTLAASIHVVHYYRQSSGRDRMKSALRLAWKPCFLAMLTTAVGMASLMVSDMAPVRQFGFGAALGSMVSLFVGFGMTPAALTRWSLPPEHRHAFEHRMTRIAFWVVDHSRRMVVVAVLMILTAGTGLMSLASRIDPMDFLPADNQVRRDVTTLETKFASTNSIEVVADFGGLDLPFAEKLRRIREIGTTIESHPSIEYAVSAATFFPERLPADAFEVASLLSRAQSQQGDSGFMAEGDRLWRISARFAETVSQTDEETIADLKAMLPHDIPVRFTGMAMLLEHAQHQIFDGFWESFTTAFLIISVVMIISLRSLKAGLIAMIPNLTPVCLIFGMLGWLSIPVEIGTMMTGSIALGLAVDGTFHYLVRYQEHYGRGDGSSRAARKALMMTGGAIFNASLITALGMLALGLSSFAPTARFGMMMTALMFAALIGDLILLPALLSLRPERPRERRHKMKLQGPHAAMDEAAPIVRVPSPRNGRVKRKAS